MISEKIPEIQNLSVGEKWALLSELWDSLTNVTDVLEVPEGHKETLKQRLTEHEARPEEGSSWEDAKSRVTSRHGT